MTVLWGSNNNQNSPIYRGDEADVADTGLADVGLQSPHPESSTAFSMVRPQLQRNQAQPPSHQPPPPPAPQQIGNPTDSLSLMQLRRIVTEFPRIEPIAYAFTYADTASYEEEIEEWFSYTDAEFTRLRNAQDIFERRWKKFDTRSWGTADKDAQEAFIKREIAGLQATDLRRRCKSLQTLLHISLGVWDETAGVENSVVENDGSDTCAEGKVKSKTVATKTQVDFIRTGVLLITECGGVPQIYELFKRAFDRLWYSETPQNVCSANSGRNEDVREPQIPDSEIALLQDELFNVTTIMYILIESARNDMEGFSATYRDLGMGL
jgi:hypothetical protein